MGSCCVVGQAFRSTAIRAGNAFEYSCDDKEGQIPSV